MRVRYENLKAGTAGELARVFDWIGVGQDETMCAEIVANNSLAKTMKKLDAEGFSEFARPSTDQPAPLGALQKAVIRAVTRRTEESLLRADDQDFQT